MYTDSPNPMAIMADNSIAGYWSGANVHGAVSSYAHADKTMPGHVKNVVTAPAQLGA